MPGLTQRRRETEKKKSNFLLCETLRPLRLCVNFEIQNYAAAGELVRVPSPDSGVGGGIVPLKLFHFRNGINPIPISANWLATNASNQ
jgi:hypothetical protein